MGAAAKKYWPMIFLAAPIVILAIVTFFQGKVPFPTSFIANDLGPWSRYLPHGPIKNGIPDVPGEIFPARSLVIDFWRSGIVPLWNPYVFSGTPFLANFQSAAFFPFNILFFILPQIDAWSILTFLQPILAGIFTYLFSRSLGRSKIASVVSGIAFMFSGFLTVWNTYLTLGYTVLFLPLVLYLIEKKQFPFITLVMGISFFSGHLQSWFYVFLAVLIYSLLKKNFLSLIFLLLSIFLVAVQLLPTWEFYNFSSRSLAQNDPQTAGVPLTYLITLFSPDFFGNPVTRNDWFGTYAEWSSYVGLIALIFSFAGLISLKKNKQYWPVFALFILGAILFLKTPLLQFLTSLPIPVLKNSNPARAVVLVSFSLSVFAGLGFDLFYKDKKYLKNILKTAIAISLFLLAILFFVFNTKFSHWEVSLRNLLFSLTILGAFWFLLLLYWKTKIKQIILLIALLILFDSLRFYLKWTPFDLRAFAYPENKISQFLQSQRGFDRFYGQFNQAPAYFYQLLSPEGYEPLNLKSYTKFLTGSDGYVLEAKLQSRDPNSKRLMDLLGVKYFIFGSEDLNNPFQFPISDYPQYPKIFDDHKFSVFENTERILRPQVFYDYEVVSYEKTLPRLFSEEFNFKNTLLVSEDPELAKVLGTGSAEIKEYLPNKTVINVNSSQPGLLFLSDNNYPGWKAELNNRETKIFTADYTFRAVKIPAGKSQVKFIYDPLSFKIGLVVSTLTLFFLLGVLLKR